MSKPKPRILMIIHKLRPGEAGGAEFAAERLAVELVRQGYAVQILTHQPFPEAPAEEDLHGVKIHRVSFNLPYDVWLDGVHAFRYLVQHRKEYDLLHCHLAFGHAMVGVIAARLLGKKCIVKTALSGSWGDFATLQSLDGYEHALAILKQADAFVCVSRQLVAELPQAGIDPHKIVHIPNGVDAGQFSLPAPRGVHSPLVFLQSGRLHPQKGVDLTLQAARLLKQRGLGERFRIRFYGKRYPGYDYPALARELGVDDVAFFGEYSRNVYPLYATADAFLLPSRAEGMSNALLEAMAMELPVIAACVSGSVDALTDGVDGTLIEPERPAALADAMQRYIEQPEWALQLGRAARQTVAGRYQIAAVAGQYARLYDRLWGRPEEP